MSRFLPNTQYYPLMVRMAMANVFEHTKNLGFSQLRRFATGDVDFDEKQVEASIIENFGVALLNARETDLAMVLPEAQVNALMKSVAEDSVLKIEE